MSNLTTLSSGSQANGYLLQAGKDQLIIECGVPVKECLGALFYDITNVRAVICTHKHSDHAGYIKQYQTYFDVYSCQEVADKYDGVKPLKPMTKYKFGGFTVTPLKVPHGDAECLSFIIDHADIGRAVFITDAEDYPYSVKGINHLWVEANYSDDIRIEAMLNGAELRAQSRNHMEIGETIRTINRLKSPELQSVVLLHLSQGLSDAEGFKRRIFNECGVHAEVAEKNKVFPLVKEEF